MKKVIKTKKFISILTFLILIPLLGSTSFFVMEQNRPELTLNNQQLAINQLETNNQALKLSEISLSDLITQQEVLITTLNQSYH